MHTLGKVLLGLIAVLAIVALILTSMLYDAQGAWQQRVEKAQTTRDDLAEQVRVKEAVVRDLEADANRMMMPWGRAWELGADEVQMQDAAAGTVRLAIGLSDGLAVRETAQSKPLPTIYLFGRNEDNTTNYLGAFRVTAVEADQALAQLIRTPYPGEVEQWQAPAGVRVWEGIPSHWRALHANMQAQNATAMQDVVDHQARLNTQKELVAKSQTQLERRLAQLNGNQNPVPGAGQDTIDGLVLALRKEENVRNQQLAELDRLRHEFNAKYNQLVELLERNSELEGRLPASQTVQPAEQTVGTSQDPSQRR